MTVCRIAPLLFVSVLLLSGCTDSPESAIDDMAEKSKELVQGARALAEDASGRVGEELDKARKTTSDKLVETVEQLNEQ